MCLNLNTGSLPKFHTAGLVKLRSEDGGTAKDEGSVLISYRVRRGRGSRERGLGAPTGGQKVVQRKDIKSGGKSL